MTGEILQTDHVRQRDRRPRATRRRSTAPRLQAYGKGSPLPRRRCGFEALAERGEPGFYRDEQKPAGSRPKVKAQSAWTSPTGRSEPGPMTNAHHRTARSRRPGPASRHAAATRDLGTPYGFCVPVDQSASWCFTADDRQPRHQFTDCDGIGTTALASGTTQLPATVRRPPR